MKRLALLLCLLPSLALAQSSPNWPLGYQPSMAEWNAEFASKYDATNGTLTNPNISGGTINGAAIGNVTPGAGAFTTLSSSSGAINATIGSITPAAGSFTTIGATGAVNTTSVVGYQRLGVTILNVRGGSLNVPPQPGCLNNCETLVGALAGANLPTNDILTTAVGFGALYSANPTQSEGTESTAIGWLSQSLMNGPGPYYNTTVGINTLGFCTTGCFWNVAIGTDSMRNALGNVDDVGVGPDTLSQGAYTDSIAIGLDAIKGPATGFVSGQFMIGIGTNALINSNATTATDDIAIGFAAISACTTCSFNIAIGTQAGQSMTTDSKNVYIGWKSGNLSAGSTQNTALGWGTMLGTMTSAANQDTAIGTQSQFRLTSGFFNTSLGFNSCSQVTSGTENLCLGTNSGQTTLATGNGNILIASGHQAVDTAAAGTNFTINVENVWTATGTNTPSTSGTTIAGTLFVNGGYVDGIEVGVTCSGSPTSGFLSSHGLVVHC